MIPLLCEETRINAVPVTCDLLLRGTTRELSWLHGSEHGDIHPTEREMSDVRQHARLALGLGVDRSVRAVD